MEKDNTSGKFGMEHEKSSGNNASTSVGADGAHVSSLEITNSLISDCQLVTVIETLESFVKAPLNFYGLPEEVKRRLMSAAGVLSRPCRTERRNEIKQLIKKQRTEKKRINTFKRNQTNIRKIRSSSIYVKPPILQKQCSTTEGPGNLALDQKCYTCKSTYTKIHFFYDQLCEQCARLNYRKRFQTADLVDRVALVTGGRLKIGYQTAIKLLQAGCRVIVTSRFPRDAARRYAEEEDFHKWSARLEIYGIDLRHTPSVESFAAFLDSHLPRLDFIIHNACQTIRRPAGFYQHLLELEKAPINQLTEEVRSVLGVFTTMSNSLSDSYFSMLDDSSQRAVSAVGSCQSLTSSELTQVPLTSEDVECGKMVFPAGELDSDQQQLDLRTTNSWRYSLADVPTVEVLEVHLVNAIAPFILNSKLKPLMNRCHNKDKHIVNVSAMEGQFYRKTKTHRHPHTNMAKAALNMMTRTSAGEYAKEGIHMNSVDTGWVSEENPFGIAENKRLKHDFHPPLDIIDGAARILDPIFDGINTDNHNYGCFFKDYKPTFW